MLKYRITVFVVLLLASAAGTRAQDWKRYIAEKDRGAIFQKATAKTGLTAKFISKKNAQVLWVTDEVARAIVSDMLDKKHIRPNEADEQYFDLRPFNHYLFYLFIKVDKKSPWGPLDQQAFSLYKENDQRNRLSSGEVREANFNEGIREALDAEFEVKKGKQYVVLVPRKNSSGEPILNDLNDETSAMFSLQGKELFLKFKISELVAQLKDL
jgi:hypothetical protein